MKYQIAVAQIDTQSNLDANLDKIREMTAQAGAAKARLIAFPENAEYIGPNLAEHAHPLVGEVSQFFQDIAVKHNIYVQCGSITEINDYGLPYNSSLLFSNWGRLIAKYHKIHMFDLDSGEMRVQESRRNEAGDEIVLCQTRIARMGMTICYDLRFPELFRILAQEGAQVVFVPSNFTYDTGKAHWETLLRARAIENSCYIVAANQCGQKPKYRAYGHSMVIDPWGEVIAEAGEGEELLFAEIDTEKIEEVRRRLPSFSNRRTDVYDLSAVEIHVYEE